MKLHFKSFSFGIFVCLLAVSTVGVFAVSQVLSKDISYDNSSSGLNATNAQDAIDEIKSDYVKKSDYVGTEYTFSFNGAFQTFIVPYDGVYKIELWGASGATYYSGAPAGNGAYTSGVIELTKNTNIYVYVGGTGENSATVYNKGGWNGGGYSSNYPDLYDGGGGGSTDVRLVSGDWNNTTSLASRIMVAAGGGGGGYPGYVIYGGYGGALIGGSGTGGYSADFSPVTGATQVSTGSNAQYSSHYGSFGYAPQAYSEGYGSGAGGGYYGGINGYGTGGSGGSSYISGYTGCVAIQSATSITPKSGCTTGTSDVTCSYHYSGYKFSDAQMIAGNTYMPTHDGTSTMTGNSGNGYAKITLVSIN